MMKAIEVTLSDLLSGRMKVTIDEGAFIPTRAHATDAGLDLYSTEDKYIWAGSGATFATGVHVQLPKGTYGKIESRSGLNIKYDVVSCGGVIDENYTGEIKVKLYNFGSAPYRVSRGDRIAQMVIMPYIAPELEVVDVLDETDRGTDGFGSSGK